MNGEIEKQLDNLREEFNQLIFELMSELDKTKCDEGKAQRLLGAAHYIHQKLNDLWESEYTR